MEMTPDIRGYIMDNCFNKWFNLVISKQDGESIVYTTETTTTISLLDSAICIGEELSDTHTIIPYSEITELCFVNSHIEDDDIECIECEDLDDKGLIKSFKNKKMLDEYNIVPSDKSIKMLLKNNFIILNDDSYLDIKDDQVIISVNIPKDDVTGFDYEEVEDGS